MRRLVPLALALTTAAAVGACCCPGGPVVGARPRPPPPRGATLEPPSRSLPKRILDVTRDARVRSALSRKRVKGLRWEDVNLDQAVTYLQTISGHMFHTSTKVREEKFEDIVINAQLDDVSVADVLTVVLTEPFGLRWEVRDGVVWLLTSEELDGPIRSRRR